MRGECRTHIRVGVFVERFGRRHRVDDVVASGLEILREALFDSGDQVSALLVLGHVTGSALREYWPVCDQAKRAVLRHNVSCRQVVAKHRTIDRAAEVLAHPVEGRLSVG
jgi:hypothetical protein